MITVGVTGPIGSGKSTVCKEWERFGAPVFYADEEAKKLMVSNPMVKEKLVETFGANTYREDGLLNKPHLIREAFEKKRAQELNNIVHPAVADEFRFFCKEARRKGEKIAVKEAALLLNDGRPETLNLVVIVMSDREKRMSRVGKRDGVDRQKVQERDEHQPDFHSLLHHADYVIENNGTLEELRVKSAELFKKILSDT